VLTSEPEATRHNQTKSQPQANDDPISNALGEYVMRLSGGHGVECARVLKIVLSVENLYFTIPIRNSLDEEG
jgi:hypothetical protein